MNIANNAPNLINFYLVCILNYKIMEKIIYFMSII